MDDTEKIQIDTKFAELIDTEITNIMNDEEPETSKEYLRLLNIVVKTCNVDIPNNTLPDDITPNDVLIDAIEESDFDEVVLAIKLGAYNICEALIDASDRKNILIINYLITTDKYDKIECLTHIMKNSSLNNESHFVLRFILQTFETKDDKFLVKKILSTIDMFNYEKYMDYTNSEKTITMCIEHIMS